MFVVIILQQHKYNLVYTKIIINKTDGCEDGVSVFYMVVCPCQDSQSNSITLTQWVRRETEVSLWRSTWIFFSSFCYFCIKIALQTALKSQWKCNKWTQQINQPVKPLKTSHCHFFALHPSLTLCIYSSTLRIC